MNNRILVVDDEPDILTMIERILKLEDYTVSTASGGKQAIEMIHKASYDLVITDIRMPEMDGLEVIRQIKAFDDTIEIIVLSGFATLDTAIEALKNGRAFHFVMKPLNDIDSFYHIISQALEKRHLRLQNQHLLKDLENVNKHLEEQVNQKTADLNKRIEELETLQQELTKALHNAESANRAKSDFLSIMSHEMKTPLNIILGNADLLLLDTGDPEENLQIIKKTCLSFSEMFDDILLFSSLDQDQKKIMRSHFTIDSVISGIEKILHQRAKEKGLTFQITIDKNIPFNLLGKWRLIRQVIYNLTGNAIKFTEEGGCQLNISAQFPAGYDPDTSIKDTPIDLCVEIFDTGIGIEEEQKNVIFDWFYQADQSITRKYGGVGMGLSLCKKLVDLMNGKIWLESQENQGSRFFFQIPVLATSEEIPLFKNRPQNMGDDEVVYLK
ncbi:MAG: response regulator [Candidatus Magnetomorum sp.]|nr:response regulator [Candidatus Magnetomorum sp.]